MSYSLMIPAELLSELYHIREKTGKSIRKQILEAVKEAIARFRELERETTSDFTSADGQALRDENEVSSNG